MSGNLRIAMWSGPRNISTAMMRAFENRDDTNVGDEPLYGYYLQTTGLDHPLADKIISAGGKQWESILEEATGTIPDGANIWYQKHMAQHLLDEVELAALDNLTNCFLIREPLRVVASYRLKYSSVTVDGLGFRQQAEIFQHVSQQTGKTPIVIDTKEMLQNPTSGLQLLCEALEIPFTEKMLRWPQGARASDGVWGEHWYDAVNQSTGFAPYVEESVRVPDELMLIVEECQAHYDMLFEHRLKIPKS